MRIAVAKLVSVSPYSPGKYVGDKPRDEEYSAFEERIWKDRAHFNGDGDVYIPPMAFKNMMTSAAKYKPMKIPGKGNNNYTKHITSGTLIFDPVYTGTKVDDLRPNRLYVPSDGRRGGTTRVMKIFPVVDKWKATATFLCGDDEVPKEVFEMYLKDAGSFIGVGTFRPQNNGWFGRFEVVSVDWQEVD